jgi:hypothetical protein
MSIADTAAGQKAMKPLAISHKLDDVPVYGDPAVAHATQAPECPHDFKQATRALRRVTAAHDKPTSTYNTQH